jgi:hypothetical protein
MTISKVNDEPVDNLPADKGEIRYAKYYAKYHAKYYAIHRLDIKTSLESFERI